MKTPKTTKAKPKNVSKFTSRDLGAEFYLRNDEVLFWDSRADLYLPKGTSVLLVSLPNRFRICTTLFSDTYPFNRNQLQNGKYRCKECCRTYEVSDPILVPKQISH